MAEDPHFSQIHFRTNHRLGKLHRLEDNDCQDWERFIEKRRASSKVEHPFRCIKVRCGFRKTVYRGIKKNWNGRHVLFASSNLYALEREGRKLPIDL